MYVRQALKNFNHDGDCLNVTFPYRGTYPAMKAMIAEKPEEYAKAAAENKLVAYCRLYSEKEIKKAIMLQGAVVVGVTTYKGCMGKNMKVPTANDKQSGGHAMCCVGWNKDGWIIQNSWGKSWGDKGFCYMPYAYPVDEWWGLTASPVTPKPEKDKFFKRLVGWFKMVWQNIKSFFHKSPINLRATKTKTFKIAFSEVRTIIPHIFMAQTRNRCAMRISYDCYFLYGWICNSVSDIRFD